MKRRLLAGLAVLSVAALVVAKSKPAPSTSPDERQRAVHALERLTFGPRPGDTDKVLAIGVNNWIDLQLHPDKIDDSVMQSRLAQYRTLQMSTREMALNFPPNPLLKAAMEGKATIPSDPYGHAIYMAGIARLQNKRDEKQSNAASQSVSDAMLANATQKQPGATQGLTTQIKEDRREAHSQIDSLSLLPPDQRMQRILALPAVQQAELLKGLPGSKKQALLAGLAPQQRETIIALDNPQALIDYEVQSGKLLRAIYSDRQLEEVLTDFWFNHFNVYIGKGADRYFLTAYERDVIRPHVLGKFKDLLVATAQSPAMLFYLDNWQSEGPDSPAATGQPQKRVQNAARPHLPNSRLAPHPVSFPNPRPQQPATRPNQQTRRSGLNENYARELMELHTLGVNGGYTQKDVTEVARVFTGWTLQEPREGGGFVFKEKLHEPGTKIVMGHKIKETGEKEGLQVLDVLAHHSSTAHFISLKLAQRFVADNPPPALVDHMATTFRKTDGDLREVMRTMLKSPEFWAPETYRAKVKTPLEFVVSCLRATASEVNETQPVLRTLSTMGMQLFGMQPPTGYSTNADAWVNSAALLDRMNFAVSLVNNKIAGTSFDSRKLLPHSQDLQADDPYVAQSLLEELLLSGDISKQTHQTIEKEVSGNVGTASTRPGPNITVALLLGSPEFQRR
jgi:uncharacterized protein (DUF1800 family)